VAIRYTALVLVFGVALGGCNSQSDRTASDPAADSGETSTSVGSTEKAGDAASADDSSGDVGSAPDQDSPVVSSGSSGEFVLGNLIEPFTPPTLDEIEADADWQDQPVVDALALLRETKKNEPALVSVDQALALRNDSDEANQKILSALSMLAPPDGEGVDYDARIQRGLQMDVVTTNPLLQSSIAEVEVATLIGFGLFGFDWTMQPFALAETVKTWQTSADRMMDKVVLRDDLKWSDGTPITAHDVVFSYKAIMTEQVPVPAVRQGTTELAWVEAYDDHTLIFFQKRAEATNVWHLNFPVIPKHIYQDSIADDPSLKNSEYHTQVEKNPVVGGPYRLTKWTRAREIVLERRDDYYQNNGKQVREKPYFKEIRFSIIEDQTTRLLALKSGSIHESELGAEQWATQTDSDDFYRTNTKARGPEWTYFYIGWNLRDPLFADRKVRRALAHVMNYDEMLNDLSFGLYPQCRGMFAPDSWMFPADAAEPFLQDLDAAEDMLDDAGWEDSDGDGIRDKVIDGKLVPFKFTLLVSNKPDRIEICRLFAEDLDNIGIECTVRPLDAAVFQERMFKKNFQAAMSGWGSGADPYTNENIFGTGEERNYGSYSNPRVDELFRQGMAEFDRDKRAKIYGEIHKLVFDDQPYLFLYNRSSFYGFKNNLRGYRFSPRGPFHYSPGFGSIWPAMQ
jgi:peptide/nickel transport system substrate-binding protein